MAGVLLKSVHMFVQKILPNFIIQKKGEISAMEETNIKFEEKVPALELNALIDGILESWRKTKKVEFYQNFQLHQVNQLIESSRVICSREAILLKINAPIIVVGLAFFQNIILSI